MMYIYKRANDLLFTSIIARERRKQEMEIRTELVERTSKSGKRYQCLELYLTDDYKKVVFLDKAELALVELSR